MIDNFVLLLNAGFRSRVRYIDVLDPTNMSHYVSEVVDAGRDGPLFMVLDILFGWSYLSDFDFCVCLWHFASYFGIFWCT